MPKDKTQTLEKIIPCAKKEFLKKGFAGASMRSIAAAAGMSAAGLYCHFENKEKMFEALVSPVYNEFLSQYRAQTDRYFEQLENIGIEPMWDSSRQTMGMFMEYIYKHLDEFKLLLSCSEQTPFAHFSHTLIDIEVEMTFRYIEKARELGYPIRDFLREEIHILSNALFSCIYEMVLHDVPREKALKLADRLAGFFTAGWKDYMFSE